MRKGVQEVTLLTVAATWGLNYTIGKYGVTVLSPVAFNALRFLMAAPLLLLLTSLFERSVFVEPRHLPRMAAVGLVGITLYQSFFMLSVQYASAAKASLLIAASPVFTSLFSALFKQESWSWFRQLGSLVALAGAAIVLLGGREPAGAYPDEAIGIAAGFAASVSWGLYPVVTAPLLKSYSALRITAWSSAIGALPLIAICAWQGFSPDAWPLPMPTWGSLLYSVVLVTIFGLIFWYRNVSRVGPSRVMLYMYLIPLFAVFFAFVLNGEAISFAQVAGFFVTIGGLALSGGTWRSRRQKRSTASEEGKGAPL
ncbi:DMT family transporter [Cohnella xylanilytica]|uniref:DMT family transporter n=1 Tax=Cohnella xylanilytica TaxID=557555 RepID=A0A841U649_9BACL|nr:DMT family transporter [Cohnella xylanilytica]MBB6693521.1 DMT family transporter [Cohnella xylanilytica]